MAMQRCAPRHRQGTAGSFGRRRPSDFENHENLVTMRRSTDSEMPLFVGITTLPSRIGYLRPTLDSLKAQTRPPDKILLCLPRWSHRENCAYVKPDWLADYAPMLEVIECKEDWGPGTKLLGCLDRLTRPTCLVIADDDMRYRPFFMEGLYSNQLQDTRSSFSYWTFRYGPIVIGQGADGFSFYSPNLDGIRRFADKALRSPELRLVDDLWISAFLMRRGLKVRSLRHLIPDSGTVYEPVHALNQLSDIDGEFGRGAVTAAGTRYLLETGLVGRRAQAKALLKRALRSARRAMPGR